MLREPRVADHWSIVFRIAICIYQYCAFLGTSKSNKIWTFANAVIFGSTIFVHQRNGYFTDAVQNVLSMYKYVSTV